MGVCTHSTPPLSKENLPKGMCSLNCRAPLVRMTTMLDLGDLDQCPGGHCWDE
jgi:hypothetical protein